MSLRFTGTLVLSFLCLIAPSAASAQVQTFTATHMYILGDHDSKDDARQRCLLETKRKILEQAGVYIESASEVKDLQLTKDKITSFAAAVMQVKDTKEEVGFQQGHMTLTLTLKADVDLAEVRKQPAVRHVDASVRDDVAAQKERLKFLESQLEAMQQQMQQAPGRTPALPMRDFSSAADVQMLHTWAAQGNAKAQFFLGLMYNKGEGVTQDYAQAAKWYEKAATQGNAKAQVLLGTLYYNGEGVTQDYAQAAKWYEKAAIPGSAEAQFLLGTLYDSGEGVTQDYAQAAKWYEKAAAQGNVYAQSSIGLLYAMGQGVPQNYAMARHWFEQSAAQGDASAQSGLGDLYFGGLGVQRNYTTARQWYEQAATQGDAIAQSALGMMYENGRGVQQDYVRAYMWFNLAVEQYQRQDGKRLELEIRRDAIAKQMNPAKIAEAQKLAREWKPKSK
jgi:uncharacterized protein